MDRFNISTTGSGGQHTTPPSSSSSLSSLFLSDFRVLISSKISIAKLQDRQQVIIFLPLMNVNCVIFFSDLISYLKSQRLSYLHTTNPLHYVGYWHKILLLGNNLKHFNTTCDDLSLTENHGPRNPMERNSLTEICFHSH